MRMGFQEGVLVEGVHGDREAWISFQNRLCGVQPVHYGHLEIEQDHVWMELDGQFDGLGSIGGLATNNPSIGIKKDFFKRYAQGLIVVDDEYAWHWRMVL
jgi:hypothetical protein